MSSDTAALRPLRSIVDDALAAVLDDDRRAEFLVAVNEAATNAVQAHQRNKVDRPFQVIVDLDRRHIVVDDHGAITGNGRTVEADPGSSSIVDEVGPALPLPPPSSHRGRGHHIIRAICPAARILRTDHGIRVELPLD